MKQGFIRTMLAVLTAIALPYPAAADEHDSLYREYIRLYCAQDKDQQFYKLSNRLKKYYLDRERQDSYYKIEMNEAIYECDHHSPYQAIRKSIEVLNKMKDENYNGENLVYLALGTIFQSCGNQKVAEHYYKEAINNINDHNDQLSMDAYSRMANLLMMTNPQEARTWNSKYEFLSEKSPNYHQVYLFVETVIDFTLDNREAYEKSRKAYMDYHEQGTELDNFGMDAIRIMDLGWGKDYKEALQQLENKTIDLTDIGRYDLSIIISRRHGQYEEALQTAIRRAQCVDSLNLNLQLHSINELSIETALVKTRTQAASDRIRWMTIVLILAVAFIFTTSIMTYRRMLTRNRLKSRNEQLRQALSMAEESDKMKSEFVRSVSHEIRTPLNAINGFAEIVTNPAMELPANEREDLINRINDNVNAITDIVDNMLKTADLSSTDYYPKTGNLLCNQVLSQLLYSYRDKVSSKIELRYTTGVMNRFSIHSNQNGLEQILTHLIENSIKFTTEGSIELNCSMADQNTVAITLTDTGCGIPQDRQEKIFDQFYKVNSFQQGIGLGLTVSKKIAQKLGGDLTIDNTYTNGARFVLTLPVE